MTLRSIRGSSKWIYAVFRSLIVPQPVFMYYVAHVFGLPLAIIAFDHSELKLLKYFFRPVPAKRCDVVEEILSCRDSVVVLYIRILIQS